MKKSNLIPYFVAGFLVMTGLSTQAASFDGGNSGGGGGDVRCTEYSNMVGRVALALTKIGQRKVSETLSIVNVSSLWEIKRSLKCIPVKELNRQAFSTPRTRTTQLLVADWETLSLRQKYRLAIHELAVLGELEGDGEYFISDELIKIIRDSGKLAIEPVASEMVTENPDGSETYTQPRILNSKGVPVFIYGEDIKQYNSLCIFMGYSEGLNGAYVSSSKSVDYAWTENGRLGGFYESYTKTITSVTCK